MYHSHSRDLDYFTLRNGRMFVWFSHALPHATKLSAKYAIILSYPIISYHIHSYPIISYQSQPPDSQVYPMLKFWCSTAPGSVVLLLLAGACE